MSVYIPSKGTRNILQVLINEEMPMSVDRIAKFTKASRRMVYYDLENVRYLLKTLGVGELESNGGAYFLQPEQIEVVKNYLTEKNTILNKDDRIGYIICSTISSHNIIRLESLAQKFEISKNATLYDLAETKKILEDYQLKLRNSKKKGYYVDGDTFRKRSVFLHYLTQLLKNNNYASLDIFNRETIDLYISNLKKVSMELNLLVHENDLVALSYLLLLIRELPDTYQFNVVNQNFIMGSKELKIIDQYFTELYTHERIYLMIYLLNYTNNRDFLIKNEDKEFYLLALAAEIIGTFELVSCLKFEQHEELVNSIYAHLKLSYYNYLLSLPTINPLQNEIKENYADLFKMTHVCCMKLKDKFPYPLFESEITYLTMHFGASMQKVKKNKTYANVLLSCLNGITGSRLLKTEVENQFENIVVIDTIKPTEVNSYAGELQIDFVISTVNFDCKYPIILVNPILAAEDKANIASIMTLLNIEFNTDSRQLKILLDIVKRNVDEDVYIKIRKELNQYLNSGGSLLNTPITPQATLINMIELYGVQVHQEVGENWENAIRKTAEVLFATNSISKNYIEAVISLAHQYGPYFVISPQIAIAHAQPKDGVSKLGVALSIYKNGLNIMGKKDIKFLFVLASPNQSDHLHILQNIAFIAEKPDVLDLLVDAKDEKEILWILNKAFMDAE
ncbi:mannitol operon transcriptional antiterminator [Neobacillus niacini]|uniref:BglG family transcription antiterminator n=1 Tax=Neobacillus niacini TaxID=86668 RepID=UPI002788D055|nr:BglG family transcription antiterminator [Neobacillus niacini]MDQ1000440.1 mannitol operon transcriptional antiterminator [Neobacillus niacini]